MCFFFQFLWLLFLSLVCRNVVWRPQPGTTLLQYIHWLCTQVMPMMNDDVMIDLLDLDLDGNCQSPQLDITAMGVRG